MRTQRVLVAHGSKYGSTAEIGEWIGHRLRAAGLLVDVVPARQVRTLGRYDAVVLGGALYVNRWHRDARRFARRFQAALRERPVWLFSSGPLDESADVEEIPAVAGVAGIAERIGARGHVTFGGRLSVGTGGFAARNLAKKMAGDYRNKGAVRAWADDIARALNDARSVARAQA